MDEKIITGKILKQRGWPEGKIIGLAKEVGGRLMAEGIDRDAVLTRLDAVLAAPRDFFEDPVLVDVAHELVRRQAVETSKIESALRPVPLDFPIWGRDEI